MFVSISSASLFTPRINWRPGTASCVNRLFDSWAFEMNIRSPSRPLCAPDLGMSPGDETRIGSEDFNNPHGGHLSPRSHDLLRQFLTRATVSINRRTTVMRLPCCAHYHGSIVCLLSCALHSLLGVPIRRLSVPSIARRSRQDHRHSFVR